jgi:single-strand DNA-binding protein
MAEGLNRVMLLGNLGADPELKVTSNGNAILKLRIATTDSYLDRNNTRQERTEWHSVSMWGKRGEALAKFLTKGDRIFVEGRLETSSYDKDGEKRYRTEIVASNVILNGGGGAREQPREERRDPPPPRRPRGAAPAFDTYDGGVDDDVPPF